MKVEGQNEGSADTPHNQLSPLAIMTTNCAICLCSLEGLCIDCVEHPAPEGCWAVSHNCTAPTKHMFHAHCMSMYLRTKLSVASTSCPLCGTTSVPVPRREKAVMCKGTTADGHRCHKRTCHGSSLCFTHFSKL